MKHSKSGLAPGKTISAAVAKSPQKPKFYSPIATIVFTVLIFFGAQLLAAILLMFYPAINGWSEQQIEGWFNETATQFLTGVLIYGLVMIFVTFALKLKKRTLDSIGLSWPRFSDAGWALAGFGVYFMIFLVLAVLASVVFPGIDFQQEQQIGFDGVEQNYQLIFVFISLVILPAVVEEVLTRGFLYKGLRGRLSIVPAALITSVIFAVAHLQFDADAPLLWAAAIDTFALSLVLVYLYEKTGRLGAPILLHMLKNGIAFTLLFIIGVN